ncbi:putative non-heme dioxygenase domain, isopenicillin N synthase [Medicago truncatula]|uniref:Putative non-heme dioxygenase domain, isopenicillin N synthase n=1 Tax=Medicago truncatula TaxID=3880 RepID=A0A396IYW2_MEDTR|nr:putative non-heme dioxygenase domain, isopenicillin N synthase [Medicago truncatula]
MASAPFISSSEPTKVDASNISSIKAFPIPSSYHSLAEPDDIVDVTEELAASIPVIDFSLLTSDDLKIHTKAVHELAKACSEWGFFMVTFSFLSLFLVVIQMINFHALRAHVTEIMIEILCE